MLIAVICCDHICIY